MLNNEINGINNNLLNDLIVDVSSYADDLLVILNEIDDIFIDSLSYINGDIRRYIKESYEGFNKNYKYVNSNILSYGTDYARVKSAYISRGFSIVKHVNSIEKKQLDNYKEEL